MTEKETRKKKETPVLAWHLLPGDMRLNASHSGDNRRVRIGETLSVKGAIVRCRNGLHACERAADTISYRPYAKNLMFCRVEVWGDIDRQDDKLAGRYRKVLWVVPPEQTLRVLVKWALECAKKALENERAAGREPDKRSWDAIEASQKWLDGKLTTEELTAARTAAYAAADAAVDAVDAAYAAADAVDAAVDAVDAAARAAVDAVDAAARAAAYAAADAAVDAVDAAADAAVDAAADAARAANNKLLEDMLEQLAVTDYEPAETEDVTPDIPF